MAWYAMQDPEFRTFYFSVNLRMKEKLTGKRNIFRISSEYLFVGYLCTYIHLYTMNKKLNGYSLKKKQRHER